MPRTLSVQLFSVRTRMAHDAEGTLRMIADMGFPCVEPAGFPGTRPEEMATILTDLGLRAPSAHCGLPIGDDTNRVLDQAELLGHEALITGCPPEGKDHYQGADRVKAMADLYCEGAENARARGLSVGYHNHDWDLAEVDGERGYRIFLERTPDTVLWEADLFWVARAGLNPVEFLREIGPRGRFVHFKDGVLDPKAFFEESKKENVTFSEDCPFLPAGRGQIDLSAASAVAEHTEFAVVELDRYLGDMMEAIRQSYDHLTAEDIGRGNR